MSSLTPHEQRLVGKSHERRNWCDIFATAYRENAARLISRRTLLSSAGPLITLIAFIVQLLILNTGSLLEAMAPTATVVSPNNASPAAPSNDAGTKKRDDVIRSAIWYIKLVAVVAAAAAGFVLLVNVWGWNQNWEAMIERQSEAEKVYRQLAEGYERAIYADPFVAANIEACDVQFLKLESDRGKKFMSLPQRSVWEAQWRLGRRQRAQEVVCSTCGHHMSTFRHWMYRFLSWLPFGRCDGCGVVTWLPHNDSPR